jgi:hypothetical protein
MFWIFFWSLDLKFGSWWWWCRSHLINFLLINFLIMRMPISIFCCLDQFFCLDLDDDDVWILMTKLFSEFSDIDSQGPDDDSQCPKSYGYFSWIIIYGISIWCNCIYIMYSFWMFLMMMIKFFLKSLRYWMQTSEKRAYLRYWIMWSFRCNFFCSNCL